MGFNGEVRGEVSEASESVKEVNRFMGRDVGLDPALS
jgi:hypothetical protein